ncbi:efflux RND transporter periplasmic adaptor subunit [uncultured Tateyamaria sp.]|uniref:efflux RND transporter periplasmic adaptor subunit n=1 Tax=uncultured Tateyamaria sp. TaxID=455651 RepID=UPI0026079D0D|nr:efflux RND transporter periplasmic adaptor subunit [uncultured Tateyamaria sp.]
MSEDRTSLEFEDDAGSGRSAWIAAGITIAAVLWMGSGFIWPADDTSESTNTETEAEAVSVATRPSRAEDVTLYFRGEGQAEPDRETMIRAEISGEVAEVLVEKGSDVVAGEILARLSTTRLQADLSRAEEEFDRADREFNNAVELLDRGVATVDRVSQARATLAAARAARTNAEEALDAARIEAPFDGRLEQFNVDPGEYVTAGSEVGRIVDNRPLTVSLQVPQQMLAGLRDAETARVTFITGQERDGRVAFVGSSAASETRTFLAEVVVPNENGDIPAGISAEIRIPNGQERAHFVAPSIVSLNAAGEIGVKTVADGAVVFHKVEIARAEVDGLWVTGLPDEVELITIGQGFVQDGEPVRTRPEPDAQGTSG